MIFKIILLSIMNNKRQRMNNNTYIKSSALEIPTITNEYVTASQTRSYMLNDTLLDYLELYGKKNGLVPDYQQPGYNSKFDFVKYIMKQGERFEDNIMEKLKKKFPQIVVIPLSNSKTRIERTINHMKRGTPIIAQGMIYNPILKVYGIPDLIVRSDYLNLLAETKVIDSTNIGCDLSPEWHYRIVDVKFSTLKLRADLTSLLNVGSQKAYKAQVWVYNKCLEYLQGKDPYKAYLLGRGWEATKCNITYTSNCPFSRLGVVNFNSEDKDIIDEIKSAIEWRQKLEKNGSTWILNPPSIPELYPNMNTDGYPWKNVKKDLAKSLDDITLIWQCGFSARQTAFDNGIYKWTDPDLSAETMGIRGKIIGPLVDKVLNVNRGKELIVPKVIKTNKYNWRNTTSPEFFVDIENISSVFSLEDNSINYTYLIGLSYLEDDKIIYKPFLVESINKESQDKMVEEFCVFLKALQLQEVKFWHYSNVDRSTISKLLENIPDLPNIVYCDLYDIFKTEPIIVKGSLDFSLKSITKALHQHNMIKSNYNTQSVGSGTDAIMASIVAMEEGKEKFRDHVLTQQIVKYNELDCYVLYEILEYLRKNH